MSEFICPKYGVSRVSGDTLDLVVDEERRCLDLSILQCSILRQMTFPWAFYRERLVNEGVGSWEIVDQPTAYKEALEELEELLSGAYDGPKGGCPVGEVFVDRGDGNAWDYALPGTLTADGAYHTLNMDLLIGSSATRVLLRVFIADTVADAYMAFRLPSYSNELNVARLRLGMGIGYDEQQLQIPVQAGGLLNYKISSGMDNALIFVAGWWQPAA